MPASEPATPSPRRAKVPLVGILLVSVLLGLGLARRVHVTSEYRNFAGDGWQYYHLAQTLTNEGRYAFGPKPLPLAWTRLPGYPLFLTLVGAGTPRFNETDVAVRATGVQAGLDLLTALFAFLLAAEAGLRAPRYLALALCLASPLLALCTSYILSESLAVLLTTATLWLLLRAGRPTRLGLAAHLAAAGALAGLGLLVRADAVTLLPCFAVPLLVTREPIGARARAALAAALAAALVFAPWPLRNMTRFGAPHLLGSSWVGKTGDPLPTGVQAWLATWAVEPETATVDIAWKMTRGTPVYAALLPAEAFDSPDEKKRVNALFEQYSREGLIGPAVEAGFQALARERRARDPMRFFVKLPLRRAEALWLRPVPDWEMPIVSPTLALPERRDGLAPLTRRTLLLAAAGLILALALRRGRPLALLALVAAAGRTAAITLVVPGGTQRYVLELLPLLLALAALALAGPAELAWARWGSRKLNDRSV